MYWQKTCCLSFPKISLTQKKTVLVAGIIVNKFFFLSTLEFNDLLSPPPKNELKKEENEDWYHNWIFLN